MLALPRRGSPALCVDRDGVGPVFGWAGAAPHCWGMTEPCHMPGCRVERIMCESPDLLHIAAHGTKPGGRCPDCGRASWSVHSRYRRRPADLPSLGRAVRVGLRVRGFLAQRGLDPAHLRRAPTRTAETPRAPHLHASQGVGAGRGGAQGRRQCAPASVPVHAGECGYRTAPGPEPAAARARPAARRGRG